MGHMHILILKNYLLDATEFYFSMALNLVPLTGRSKKRNCQYRILYWQNAHIQIYHLFDKIHNSF